MQITQDSPTGRLRFLRNKHGKAILQQQWRRKFIQAPRSAAEVLTAEQRQEFTIGASEVWWQDVPMVSDD